MISTIMSSLSIIVSLSLIALVDAAKILVVVPTPSLSHQVVFHPLIKELVKRGHEVTSITTNTAYPRGGTPSNLREIDLHDLSYGLFGNWFKELENVDNDDFLTKMTLAYQLVTKIFEEQLKYKEVQELINNKVKFDLLIIESVLNSALIYSHLFKAPVILMSSFGASPGNMEMMGAATHPFLYPIQYHRRIYNLTIFEKISELYNEMLTNQLIEVQEMEGDRILKRLFGKDTPLVKGLRKNVDMMFLNVHPIWIHNQPVPPNVVYIWGIHRTPEKTLPEDLRSYLDSSKNGVIYISFGTNFNTSLMPADTLKVLLDVLSRLPYNILWKWDSKELPGKSENIKISKWLPQTDVLRHPNVKLFITQGGLQSTDEAIHAGVPLIAFPTIADQDYNAEKYEHFKIGIKLKLKPLTEEQFVNAIEKIFDEYDSYEKNIIKLRTLMQDTPQPPLDNAIWWIEYVLRHGGAQQLKSPAANIPWTVYYEIKLVSVLLIGLIVFISLVLYFVCFIIKCISNTQVKVKSKVW